MFAEQIPNPANGVSRILEDEFKETPSFRESFGSLAELCRQSVNPELINGGTAELCRLSNVNYKDLLKDRQLIISCTVQQSSITLLQCTAPLFEEEANVLTTTLSENLVNPTLLQLSSSPATLASNNHPIDTLKRELSQTLE